MFFAHPLVQEILYDHDSEDFFKRLDYLRDGIMMFGLHTIVEPAQALLLERRLPSLCDCLARGLLQLSPSLRACIIPTLSITRCSPGLLLSS